jgi:hypothetical protein
MTKLGREIANVPLRAPFQRSFSQRIAAHCANARRHRYAVNLRHLLYNWRARALDNIPHFPLSCFMNRPKSGPKSVPTSAPVTSKLFRKLGLDSTRLMSAVTLEKIPIGVLAGASTPNQEDASNPANPASSKVGTSGSEFSRLGLATANARTVPA